MTLSKRSCSRCIVIVLAACWTQSAFALDPRYPDWPCQQLKVPGIAIASVWNGPPIEIGDGAKPTDAKQAELVSRLAARRTPMEDARKLITDYIVGASPEKQEKAKTLFAALYSTLNAQRDEVMNGIERFSRKQKAPPTTSAKKPRNCGKCRISRAEIRRKPRILPAGWRGRRASSRIGGNRPPMCATCPS